MLSKKLTFSLASLIVLIAFGFVCAVPSAFADGADNTIQYDIVPTISAGETMVDVSARDGFQIATGRDRADRSFAEGPASTITFVVTFDRGTIHLNDPAPAADDPNTPNVDESETELESSRDAFGLDDIFIEAFDAENRSLGALQLSEVLVDTVIAGTEVVTAHVDTNNPGRAFLIRIGEEVLRDAYTSARGGGFEIYKLSFHVPRAVPATTGNRHIVSTTHWGVKNLALDHVGRDFINHEGNFHVNFNRQSNIFTIELVDVDQGNPQYSRLTSNSTAVAIAADGAEGTAGSGTPGVVGITRILDRSAFQPIESGPFDVRIILTEEPRGGLTTDLIEVMNGSATEVTKGLSLKGAITVEGLARASELTPSVVDYYTMADDAVLAEQAGLPEATGRDNMYHQYVVTITPHADVEGEVTISIRQFSDNVLPIPKVYVPLSASQRNATILTGDAETVRDARLKNETLSVRVSTEAHQDRVDLMAAWKERWDHEDDPRTGIFNQSDLDYVRPITWSDHRDLGTDRIVIPANGYLVMDRGNPGLYHPSWSVNRKLNDAQRLYNVIGAWFVDLESFFRNGGTVHLLHKDLPLSTTAVDENGDQLIGPSHTKGDPGEREVDTAHNDYTGYDGADSTEYTEGSVLISEVMWGLDFTDARTQYIELHNTTDEKIGLDPLEWVLVFGDIPSHLSDFTVIDTIGNTPSGNFWQVPGSSGVIDAIVAAELVDGQEIPVIARGDLISMSRVDVDGVLAADGTAQASWAASRRPSANLLGRQIGTPGAANLYEQRALYTPPTEEEDEMPADVATGADIMITEIMVASDGGRLPQWIELANVSSAEVSLAGWSVEIDNDAADDDVVAETIRLNIGDVVVGEDQVVLIISKAGRSSGIGTGADATGMLRSERIVDVQSQASPTDARYSLISEMSFRITLLPPQTGGAVERGDRVGNLGMGWELPMYEDGRSSIIRREMGDAGEIMGTDAAGWILAASTNLDGAYRTTYYGDDEDMGTPGYNAGGALPVELSSFSAARDKVTGQAVITWETQSELNNAGFFIKRSQQRNGNFVVVNPTMIPGAGTTSEKQSYTYTDTTAQPNVVYYYQIEDVSLDGNRQTLTRGHRLKGHIGAAGKVTTTWGDLKSSRE